MIQTFILCPWRRRAESHFSYASSCFSLITSVWAQEKHCQTISNPPRSLNVVESRISKASFAVPLTCSAMSGGSSVEALDQVHQPLPEQLRRTHTGRICANCQRPDPPRPVTNPRCVFRKNTQGFLKPVHIVHTIGWIREALRSAHGTVSAPPSCIARKNMGHPSPDTTTVSVSHTDFLMEEGWDRHVRNDVAEVDRDLPQETWPRRTKVKSAEPHFFKIRARAQPAKTCQITARRVQLVKKRKHVIDEAEIPLRTSKR